MKTITSLPPVADSGKRLPRGDQGIVDVGEAVTYRDQKTGRIWRVRVVEPREVDPERRRISRHSPVGLALVGLAVGDSADWHDRHGTRRTLKVVSIEDDLEPVGYINV
jgi:transcription elongation GreA/GreB family factor